MPNLSSLITFLCWVWNCQENSRKMTHITRLHKETQVSPADLTYQHGFLAKLQFSSRIFTVKSLDHETMLTNSKNNNNNNNKPGLRSSSIVVFSIVKWFWATSSSFSVFETPLSWLRQGNFPLKSCKSSFGLRTWMWTSFRLNHLSLAGSPV